MFCALADLKKTEVSEIVFERGKGITVMPPTLPQNAI